MGFGSILIMFLQATSLLARSTREVNPQVRQSMLLEDNGCGGSLQGPSGSFSTPNFPRDYPTDLSCTWTIQGPPNTKRIEITFPTLDVEWGRRCDFDYVLIKDGQGNQIGPKICGRPYMKMVTVPGARASVVFWSDDSDTEQGFQATYTAVTPTKPPSLGDCSFDAGLCDGWKNAESDDEFDWSVKSGQTESLLTGPDSDHSGSGQYAYIESTGRNPGDKALLAAPQISGYRCLAFFYHMRGVVGMGTLNVYLRLAGQQHFVWSETGNHGSDWKEAHISLPPEEPYQTVFEGVVGQSDYSDIAIDDITFTTEPCRGVQACGGELSGASGKFQSPGFPQMYPNNLRCVWSIKPSSQTSTIVVTFDSFHVDKEPSCSHDYVIIKDAREQAVGEERFCGLYHEGFGVKVRGNQATVYFHSDDHLGRRGFNASYVSFPTSSKDDCDFDGGLCSSWHNAQDDDFDWSINKGNTPSFFTGPHRDYHVIGRYAYIEASNRKRGQKARLVSSRMSGQRCLKFVFNMRGQYMGSLRVLIKTDGKTSKVWSASGDHGKGWIKEMVSLTSGSSYQVIFEGEVGDTFTSDMAVDEVTFIKGPCPAWTACGSFLTQKSGKFKSANYPGSYPANQHCVWTIVPPPNYSNLHITFNNINLQDSQQCTADYIQVADITGTPINSKLCGSKSNISLDISWHQAEVIFHTDQRIAGSGFSASYEATDLTLGCGGQLYGASGSFDSPSYPRDYPPRKICDWEITAPTGTKKIVLTFDDDFAIHDAPVTCSYNYLLVYDAQHGVEVGKYCGMHPPHPINITGSVANVRFHSSHFGAARGFRAHYKAV